MLLYVSKQARLSVASYGLVLVQEWWEGRRERRCCLSSDCRLQSRQAAELQLMDVTKGRDQRQSAPFGRERERGISLRAKSLAESCPSRVKRHLANRLHEL